ncbi:MAG: immunoglobulin domain-containing protein [Lacunisphaera sp.]
MDSSIFGHLLARFLPRSQRVTGAVLLASLTLTAHAQLSYATPYSFTTLAGAVSAGSVDGPGSVARFNSPSSVAVDATGNIYVADTSNGTIRKISRAGVVTTLAGKAGAPFVPHTSPDGTGSDAWFSDPIGIAVDSTGTVFVTDGNNALRKITPAGSVTSLSGDFNVAKAIAIDAAGNIYIADTFNNAIRRTPPMGGPPTLVAGGSFGSADGIGSAAQFYNPSGIAVGPAGEIYVADTWNHTIRKISSSGVVTTFAGSAGAQGSTDGSGADARFSFPAGLALDGSGNLYVADSGNSLIRKISASGMVTTIAGLAGQSGHVDGAARSAQFNLPQALALDPLGNLLVADTRNNTIRKITPDGIVSTIAGLAPSDARGSVDGLGSAARFNLPTGICLGPEGSLFVADRFNNTVRKITAAGLVTTYAGSAVQDGTEEFSLPVNLTMAPSGSVYVADESEIRRIATDGTVTTFSTGLYYPGGCAFDSTGNLIVADSGNFVIRKIAPDGTDTILAGSRLQRGYQNGTGSMARFGYMGCLAIDASDTIFLADYDNNTIRKISPAGVVSTLAGTSNSGAVDGPGKTAQFVGPWGLALDAAGNIFVTEYDNTIRRITPAGDVSTVAGSPDDPAATLDGVGKVARFEGLGGIAVDASGVLYVVSGGPGASVIRRGQLAGAPVISTQPLSQTVAPGGSALFSVAAAGGPAPTYQWYFNGAIFSGATTDQLSFTNVRSTDAGDYTVVVTNSLGSVTSGKATLTVSAPAAPTPDPAPSSGGGGGSMTAWFGCALLALGAVRRRMSCGRVRASLVV